MAIMRRGAPASCIEAHTKLKIRACQCFTGIGIWSWGMACVSPVCHLRDWIFVWETFLRILPIVAVLLSVAWLMTLTAPMAELPPVVVAGRNKNRICRWLSCCGIPSASWRRPHAAPMDATGDPRVLCGGRCLVLRDPGSVRRQFTTAMS